jgi:hypothetical protein
MSIWVGKSRGNNVGVHLPPSAGPDLSPQSALSLTLFFASLGSYWPRLQSRLGHSRLQVGDRLFQGETEL